MSGQELPEDYEPPKELEPCQLREGETRDDDMGHTQANAAALREMANEFRGDGHGDLVERALDRADELDAEEASG